ncbi:EF-hand and coiled-coil domain-containing protein 1-like [Xenopus laevis]|uniref:EF-hand and coiled-coil domain-containing protein 1-like n=1 Tax=Xenopus laevis TaxID=8355 RepID=A0A8J1N193_XENLA|nr:EF-hand and coiled-coil domain-containing protein 1-like [Xenopus laevis]
MCQCQTEVVMRVGDSFTTSIYQEGGISQIVRLGPGARVIPRLEVTRGDSYSPARRPQWLLSALTHHFGQDRGVENEIIVLATGLDQYLQEVFHHLDWGAQETIPGADFRALCHVLGLEGSGGQEECEGLLDNLPGQLTFRQFHARLCGYFSGKSASDTCRFPCGTDTELIQTQIRLRSPRRRRDPPPRSRLESDAERSLEQENSSLRELVEDLRAALQSSDARCLALQVGLRKSQTAEGGGATSDSRVLTHTYTLTQHVEHVEQVVQRVSLIQNSSDVQIQELIRINQELEEELGRSQECLARGEELSRRMKEEQVEMRRRAGEARQVVLTCFTKVKELEEKSNKVPLLQMRLKQLEMELQRSRAEVRDLRLSGHQHRRRSGRLHCFVPPQGRTSPAGDLDSVFIGEDQVFRSVEGQAASDEEEEDWAAEQQHPAGVTERILARDACCVRRCDEQILKALGRCAGGSDSIDYRNITVLLMERIDQLSDQLQEKHQEMRRLETDLHKLKEPLVEELEKKMEETEFLRSELQMLETERVRLSLVEEKLLDVLELLEKVRNRKISKRDLGKLLLSALESCREPQPGKDQAMEVLNSLHHELSQCELYHKEAAEQQPMGSSLVISC